MFADVGFDETGRWDLATLAPLAQCHAFTPNAVEAMSYTRTDTPAEALAPYSWTESCSSRSMVPPAS